MQIQARATADENPFAASQLVFTTLTKRLASLDALVMTHGDLEGLLDPPRRSPPLPTGPPPLRRPHPPPHDRHWVTSSTAEIA